MINSNWLTAILHHFNTIIMYKGTIRFYNESKGFGFIVDSASGQYIFLHVSGSIDQVKGGDIVTYDTARGKKGMNAINVQRA